MGYTKTFITWIMVLGVFVNTSLAGICFCGRTCAHGRGPEARKVNASFHMHGSDMPCKGCTLEDSQILKEVNSIKKTLYAKCLKFISTLIKAFENPPAINFVDKSGPFPAIETVSLSPSYLLNLSLLC